MAQIAKIPIQRLFFFDGPGLPPFPSVVSALRSSLADTLAVFFSLAGELAFRPSPGAVVCSAAVVSSGVRFVEAEYLGSADDMRRLAREEEHDTEASVCCCAPLAPTRIASFSHWIERIRAVPPPPWSFPAAPPSLLHQQVVGRRIRLPSCTGDPYSRLLLVHITEP